MTTNITAFALLALNNYQPLLDACEAAIIDIEGWHAEALAYQKEDGGQRMANCGGCTSCRDTLPLLRVTVARAKGEIESERMAEDD